MSAIIDDYSPIYVGDTGAAFAPIFVHADGSTVDLTGAAIVTRMDNGEGTVKDGAGTWIIDDAAGGAAHYVYNAADVATPGTWTLYIKITIGGRPVHADVKTLRILPVPQLT